MKKLLFVLSLSFPLLATTGVPKTTTPQSPHQEVANTVDLQAHFEKMDKTINKVVTKSELASDAAVKRLGALIIGTVASLFLKDKTPALWLGLLGWVQANLLLKFHALERTSHHVAESHEITARQLIQALMQENSEQVFKRLKESPEFRKEFAANNTVPWTQVTTKRLRNFIRIILSKTMERITLPDHLSSDKVRTPAQRRKEVLVDALGVACIFPLFAAALDTITKQPITPWTIAKQFLFGSVLMNGLFAYNDYSAAEVTDAIHEHQLAYQELSKELFDRKASPLIPEE